MKNTARPTGAPTTVNDYIARAPLPARKMLKAMRAAIRSTVPRGATEVISYRMPAFRTDRVLVWYAAFIGHCSLFPGGRVIGTLADDLKGFKTSKGTIQFPLDKPLPIALIKKVVKARVAEVSGRPKKK